MPKIAVSEDRRGLLALRADAFLSSINLPLSSTPTGSLPASWYFNGSPAL